jgi:hypothetical protein
MRKSRLSEVKHVYGVRGREPPKACASRSSLRLFQDLDKIAVSGAALAVCGLLLALADSAAITSQNAACLLTPLSRTRIPLP